MKMTFAYGNDAVVLPGAVATHIERATKRDLRVLFALAAEPLIKTDVGGAVARTARTLGITDAEVDAAIAFWRGTGVLLLEESGADTANTPIVSSTAPAAAPKKRPLQRERGLASYTTEELASVIEGIPDFSAFIGACQQTLGKIFNTAEVEIIVGMIDDLGFDEEYILLLLSHCVRMEKKSLRYAEKMALQLYDEDVTSATALEERLRRVETMATVTGKIRTMFGIAHRTLTAKEKTMIERWVCVMQYDIEVIRMAYESTVNAINDASIAYANTILERWYAEGLHTTEDVERAMQAYKRAKRGGSSFDLDDFIGAALKNTYKEG